MCKIHFAQCPKCSEIRPIPYLCPKIELGIKPSNSYTLVWDTDCNRPWCHRRCQRVPETMDDACNNCHDQQKFAPKSLSRECQIETVSHYCDLHVSKKEKKIGPVQIYKSEFRIQENVSQSMYASTIFCSVYIESSFSFLFF
jgi:hypothetical protein